MVRCLGAMSHSTRTSSRAYSGTWSAPRVLVSNEDKTRIVHLEEGFNFLGFNVRRYRRGQRPAKPFIKPSPDAVKRVRRRLADDMRRMRGSNALAVIARLNPIIRGWAAYNRGVVSSKIFSSLDSYLWRLTYRWARRSHPGKSKTWVVDRYFGRFHKFRNDRWVFGDPGHPRGDQGESSPTWSNSAGLPSSDTPRSRAGRLPTTPRYVTTGPTGDARSNHRWTATTSACSPSRTVAARSAETA